MIGERLHQIYHRDRFHLGFLRPRTRDNDRVVATFGKGIQVGTSTRKGLVHLTPRHEVVVMFALLHRSIGREDAYRPFVLGTLHLQRRKELRGLGRRSCRYFVIAYMLWGSIRLVLSCVGSARDGQQDQTEKRSSDRAQ